MTNTIDKRKYPRIEVRWPVVVTSNQGNVEAETKNISVNGVFIESNQRLRVGETYPMSIKPPDHQLIKVTGKIIWSESHVKTPEDIVYGFGFYFLEIDDKDWTFLAHMVSTLMA